MKTEPAPDRPRKLPWNFSEWFILSQTFLPALLYLPGTQSFRVEIRMAAYGISLLGLFFANRSRPKGGPVKTHPSVPWLLAILGYMGLMLFHPQTNSLLAGLAQIALNFSIMAPVLWSPFLVESPRRLERLLWLLLVCNGINSLVGVLQVHNPSTWMPRDYSLIVMASDYGLDAVSYKGANGEIIVRPPGLGDAPGAVAGPAGFALYLGVIFLVENGKWWERALGGIFALLAAAALFYTEVRSLFLIALGMLAIYFFVQIRHRRYRQAALLIGLTSVVVGIAFFRASSSTGNNIQDRFATLFEEDPLTTYNKNRGYQVQSSFSDLLPQYPLGAGLGRWGMTSVYFGNQANMKSPPIWVEIQLPAWIVDGGIPLLILYPVALWIALSDQTRLAFRTRSPSLRLLATVILAANAGIVALCFSYPVFISPLGEQFWFLSGAIYGVAARNASAAQSNRLLASRRRPLLSPLPRPGSL